MRLIFALAVAALTCSTGVVAAQQDLSKLDVSPKRQVTVQFNQMPLSEALQALGQMVSIEIRLAPEVDGSQPVTVRLVNAPFKDALELLLNSPKLTYAVTDARAVLVTEMEATIRLKFEVYRDGSLVAKPQFQVADKAAATLSIDGLATVTFTPTRIDAERIAVAFEIAAGGQPFSPRVVLRNREPGTISWKSLSNENVEMRVVSP